MAVIGGAAAPYGLTNAYGLGVKPAKSKITIRPPVNPFLATIQNAKASLMGPAGMGRVANQQVNANINAQLGASNASSKAEQAGFADLQNRAAGLAAALSAVGQPGVEATGAAYNAAANTIGSLGTGLTGAVASDWNAANAQTQQAICTSCSTSRWA